MEVDFFLTELILRKIIINLLCPHPSEDQIWEIPFSDFPSEHQTPIDYTDFNLEDFANWLNDRGPRDIYENANNVLIVVSENQNMTNIQILNDC